MFNQGYSFSQELPLCSFPKMVGCVHGGFTHPMEGVGTDLLAIFPADHIHLLVWRTGPGAEEDKAKGRLLFHPDLPHRGCAQENAAHWSEYVHPRRSGADLPRKITVQLCKSPICFGGAFNTGGGDLCSALCPWGSMNRSQGAQKQHAIIFTADLGVSTCSFG